MWIGRSTDAFCYPARLLARAYTYTHSHPSASHVFSRHLSLSFSPSLLFPALTRPGSKRKSLLQHSKQKKTRDSTEKNTCEKMSILLLIWTLIASFRCSAMPQALQQPLNSTQLDPIQQVRSCRRLTTYSDILTTV